MSRRVQLSFLPSARTSLDECAQALSRLPAEQMAWKRSVAESVRQRVAAADGFPPEATADPQFKTDVRWFQCEPAFLVLAAIKRKTVGNRWLFIPIIELQVTIVDFSFSPDFLIRKP